MEVEIIKAKGAGEDTSTGRKIDRLRVAAYCRVSTDDEDQIKSYNSMVRYYTDLIKSNKQTIFDELLDIFEKKASEMMYQLDTALAEQTYSAKENFYETVCNTFFENYLMENCFWWYSVLLHSRKLRIYLPMSKRA